MGETGTASFDREVTTEGAIPMAKNVVRGILNLILVAAATWLANYLVEMIFGPDDEYE
jgi:hypothetical protein